MGSAQFPTPLPSSPTPQQRCKAEVAAVWDKAHGLGRGVQVNRRRKWGDASLTTFAGEKPAVEGQWDWRGHGFAKALV